MPSALLNATYPTVDDWIAGVDTWVRDLQALAGNDFNVVGQNAPELARVIERTRALPQPITAFKGIKIAMEFYTAFKGMKSGARKPAAMRDLFIRTQPLFRYGIRHNKIMMDEASGYDFLGRRYGISDDPSYQEDAAVWDERQEAGRTEEGFMYHSHQDDRKMGYPDQKELNAKIQHEYDEGLERERERELDRQRARRYGRPFGGRRSTARRSTARRNRSTASRNRRTARR